MTLWQADFYRCDRLSPQGEPLWQLLICDRDGKLIVAATCPQREASADWLVTQLAPWMGVDRPERVQCFRPQAMGLLSVALQSWAIPVEATRRTPALKSLLRDQFPAVLPLEQAPPQPLPENLWGEEWQLGSMLAGDLETFWRDRPIPIRDLPNALLPLNLGLASSAAIPGVAIYAGRRSMALARWLGDRKPFALSFIPQERGLSGGLILEADLAERWVLATFEDAAIASATENFETHKQGCKGLHFLLVQPDASGMTETGLWLLQGETPLPS